VSELISRWWVAAALSAGLSATRGGTPGCASRQTVDPPQIRQLQSAIDANPDEPKRWLALAEALEGAGRERDAVRAFGRAKGLPEAQEALGRLLRYDDPGRAADELAAAATAYDLRNDRTAADRCRRRGVALTGDGAALARLLERDPPEPATAAVVHELFERAGRPAALVPQLQRWAERLPDVAGPTVALAEAHAAAGRPDLAETLLADWTASRADAAAYRALARLRLTGPDRLAELTRLIRAKVREAAAAREATNAEQAERAAAVARAVVAGLRAEPKAAAAVIAGLGAQLRESPGDSDFDIGRLAVILAEATDSLDAVEARLAGWSRAAPRAASFSINRALLQAYEEQGKFAEIDRLCRRARENPQSAALVLWNFYRARALMHLDREAEALAEADEAVKKAGPGSMLGTRLLKLDVLEWFGRRDAARAEARKILTDFPDADSEREARVKLSSQASARGDFAEAEAHLLRALELDPQDVLAHNNLGYLYAEYGRKTDEAVRLCRYAVERGRAPAGDLDPGGDEPAYRDSLGWAYFRQGRLVAAREELEAALALPGGRRDPVIWEHLGDVLAAAGRPDEAGRAWSQALDRAAARRLTRNDPRPDALRRKLAGR
jgi:tetratricopeptide (TPR) repeat protein